MNNNNPSSACASTNGTELRRPPQPWLRVPVLFVIAAVLVALSAVKALAGSSSTSGWEQGDPGTVPPAVIYLGFKTSDEIEFDDDEQADFIYKNEDIVAFTPATGEFSIFFDGSACGLEDANLDDFEILESGNILFTLRAAFDIPGLGEVDDSDVIEYAPNGEDCGSFTLRLKGADFELTDSSEDIDGLGIAEDENLLISTIGTARVTGATGELQVRDQSLIKLDEETGTWSLYFDGEDVDLIDSSEDIRSVWVNTVTDAQGNRNIYLTLSGDFEVESANEDDGDKNDVEGCTLLPSAAETTACFFHKLLDGEEVGAENQLDGLAVEFNGTIPPAITAVTNSTAADIAREAQTEATSDAADFAEALAEGDSEISLEDLMEITSQLYLPLVQQ
jgi:hypothetical protein